MRKLGIQNVTESSTYFLHNILNRNYQTINLIIMIKLKYIGGVIVIIITSVFKEILL